MTDVTYSGTIIPYNTTYLLGGGPGELTVTSSLTGANNSIVVGGNVALSGDNSGFAGTTTVQSGTLDLLTSLPGPISVNPGAFVTGPCACRPVTPSPARS